MEDLASTRAGVNGENSENLAETLHGAEASETQPEAPGNARIGTANYDALLIANGYEPVAVNGKIPVADAWQKRPNTIEALAAERGAHPHAVNTGLRTGHLVGIDIDIVSSERVAAVMKLATEILGPSEVQRIGAKGAMICYRNETPIRKIMIASRLASPAARIEILGAGQQLVAYGIHPNTKRPYAWPNADMGDEPLYRPLADLPEVTPDKLHEFARQAAVLLSEWGLADAVITGAGNTGERNSASAPEDVVSDPPGIKQWAIALVEKTIQEDGPADVGTGLNDRTVRLAAELGDGPVYGYTVSEDLAVEIVLEHWSAEGRIEDAVRNGYRSRSNPLGCGQAHSSRRRGDSSRSFGPALPAGSYHFDLDNAIAALAEPVEDTEAEPVEATTSALVSAAGRWPRKIIWLWNGWLARGKMHVLAGEKGVGKSTVVYNLLATITRGGQWPDGTQSEPGIVVVWSAEDDFDDTILPRFLAAGGDPARLIPVEKVRVDGVEKHFDPAYDMPFLLREVRKLGDVAAILIDPIVSAVTGDSHKNAETRRGLQPIVDLAKDCGAALIGITHFTKGTDGKNPVERVTGSLAFGAIARIVLCASADEDGQQRRLVRAASNIGPMGGGFGYTLSQVPVPECDMEASRVIWGSRLQGSARELLGDGAKEDKITAATDFIDERLADGPVLSKDMREAASALNHAWPTVERARAKMPWVVVEQLTKGQRGEALPRAEGDFQRGWYWRNTRLVKPALHGEVEY